MWLATIHFMKAFDSMCHNSIWKALEICGIEQHYTSLRRTTHRPKATVLTDKENDIFENKRGTKQGDPPVCSSTLYSKWL